MGYLTCQPRPLPHTNHSGGHHAAGPCSSMRNALRLVSALTALSIYDGHEHWVTTFPSLFNERKDLSLSFTEISTFCIAMRIKSSTVTSTCSDMLTSPRRKPEYIRRNPKIRRCLFGPVDHNILDLILDEELNKAREVSQKKWNFDFENEAAIPGRYQWKVFDISDEIPEIYRKDYKGRSLSSYGTEGSVKRKCAFDVEQDNGSGFTPVGWGSDIPQVKRILKCSDMSSIQHGISTQIQRKQQQSTRCPNKKKCKLKNSMCI